MAFTYISCALYLCAVLFDVIACLSYGKKKTQTTINWVVLSTALISVGLMLMSFLILSGIVFNVSAIGSNIVYYNMYLFFVTLWLVANIVALQLLADKKIKEEYGVE